MYSITFQNPILLCYNEPQLTGKEYLFIFRQEHYLHKDKDCTQLEKSSRIPFDYWKSTVQLLTAENPYSTSSLLHYINSWTI